MRPQTHIWTSALAGVLAYPRNPARAALVLVCGVLIDLDHLVLYTLRSGDRSLVGAMVYNRYRNQPRRRGDTRPRYGSMRSWLHRPAVLLPLLLAARLLPALRPVALGWTLHVLLDHTYLVSEVRVAARARGHCELCGTPSKRLRPHTIVHPFDGGKRTPENMVALCPRCRRRAEDVYPLYPPQAVVQQ